MKTTKQSSKCTGLVKYATGEPVIGATVVVKCTTNCTITGLDGDFSLSNVKKGDNIPNSRYHPFHPDNKVQILLLP